MKKAIFAALLMLVTAVSSSAAMADVIFSSSATDATAGTNVTVNQGGTSSIFVWVSTDINQTISAIAFNIVSSDSTIAQATASSIENPGTPARWFRASNGSLNRQDAATGQFRLVQNASALTLTADNPGISTGGFSNFVLHSELSFTATGLGTTNLTFTPEGTGGIAFRGVNGNQWNNVIKGTGSITAVPEPSSALLLTGVACAAAAYRRRRAC